MKFSLSISLLLSLTVLLTGCVTEPAPPDNTVYGHVDSPKQARKKKRAKFDASALQVVQ